MDERQLLTRGSFQQMLHHRPQELGIARLDWPSEKRIRIAKGEALCRVVPVRRDTYFAAEMGPGEFDEFFARGQKWLATHGQGQHEGTVDITRTYVRQQVKSKFVVME